MLHLSSAAARKVDHEHFTNISGMDNAQARCRLSRVSDIAGGLTYRQCQFSSWCCDGRKVGLIRERPATVQAPTEMGEHTEEALVCGWCVPEGLALVAVQTFFGCYGCCFRRRQGAGVRSTAGPAQCRMYLSGSVSHMTMT